MNNAFKLLEQDHDKVKKIIANLLKTTPADKIKRRNLLQSLKQELWLHEKIEEDFVYPALKSKSIIKDLTLEAYQEHHIVDILLDELESLEFKDESWMAKLTVLQTNLLHHIKEEETDLFISAKKALTKEELFIIQENIAAAKSLATAE